MLSTVAKYNVVDLRSCQVVLLCLCACRERRECWQWVKKWKKIACEWKKKVTYTHKQAHTHTDVHAQSLSLSKMAKAESKWSQPFFYVTYVCMFT